VGRHLAPTLRWRTVAASVAGTSHAGLGQPCADACAVRVLKAEGEDPLLVAVVADGAGGSERAAEGAGLACAAVLDQAREWAAAAPPRPLTGFGREDALGWVGAARRRIAEAAQPAGLETRDFSCTLLATLVDAAAAVFLQVGDGAIVYRGRDGAYQPAFWPQSGEYANCTWFVTDEEVADRVQLAVAEGVHEVALLSDGLQALALRFVSREAHGPFFEPMFARLRGEPEAEPGQLLVELRAFLDSPPVNQRTDDDKTLVLATRLPPRPVGSSPLAAEG